MQEHAFIETVSDNMTRYTKREVAGAMKARQMLAFMGYPPVQQAIEILRDGSDYDVSE